MNRTTYDPEKFNLSIARFKKGGNNFEVVIDADNAIAYKEGSLDNIKDVLKYEKVFADAQRGQLAPENLFAKTFETDNVVEICEYIVSKGEIHITAERRKQEIERKRKLIVSMIQRNGVDPRTGVPHTAVRVSDAIDQAKVHIDEFKPIEVQVKEIIKALQPILPIRFETKLIGLHLPAKYSHSAYNYVKTIGKIKLNKWNSDQSWDGQVEIPGGLEEEFYDNLNKLTHGCAETHLLQN